MVQEPAIGLLQIPCAAPPQRMGAYTHPERFEFCDHLSWYPLPPGLYHRFKKKHIIHTDQRAGLQLAQ